MKINDFLVNNRSLINSTQIAKSEETKDINEGMSFLDTLKEKLDEVNDKQIEAENVTEAFIKGEDVDIHEVMLKSEEAKLSLQMAVQIRNKLVEAYQELNRMQL
jgi:flagellar hook-basal body complex protein FliE